MSLANFQKSLVLVAVSAVTLLVTSIATYAQDFASGLSQECRTVLSNLGPRTQGCSHSPPYSPEEIDARHGDGYFAYIWNEVLKASEAHGVSPGMLMGLLMKESHFMPTAVSCSGPGNSVGAQGIGQLIIERAAATEAMTQLSNQGQGEFDRMLEEREVSDPNFTRPNTAEHLTTLKFNWIYGIASQYIDGEGINRFVDVHGRNACYQTDQIGRPRPCPSTESSSAQGLRDLPGCLESLQRTCTMEGGLILTNLFCPNFNITLAAVYLRHIRENRLFRAEHPTEESAIRGVIGRYNNSKDKNGDPSGEQRCHVHAIAGLSGGFGGSHMATYCTLENDYFKSPNSIPRARSESVR